MYFKKTGYPIAESNDTAPIRTLQCDGIYKLMKTGYITSDNPPAGIQKRAGSLQGFAYYQIICNDGACDDCAVHDGAIYPVAYADDPDYSPPFHPNCKCTVQGYFVDNPYFHPMDSGNLIADPWKREIEFWLGIMFGGLSPEQQARMLINYYDITDYTTEEIAGFLASISEVMHVGRRIEAFLTLLSNPMQLSQDESFSKIVVNHSVPSSSIEWKISNEDFLNKNAMTYEEIYEIIRTQTRNPEWAANPEEYARAIYEITQNFRHSDFRLDTSWRHESYNEKLKTLVPVGAVGINPKVILTTLLAESEYGSTTQAYFGSTSARVRQLDLEGQLDVATNQYLQYYYWGLYASGNMPELYDIQIQTGTKGSYTPANAAMYARGQYCTDDLSVFESWQDIYLNEDFR